MTRLFMAAAAVLFTAATASAAPLLLGTTGQGTDISTLVEIDPATGALVRTIGSVGFTVNGLTYDTTTGTLYGSTSARPGAFNGLIAIDMTTGLGTPVGTGWQGVSPEPITNLEADASGDIFGWTEAFDDLVTVDKVAGTFAVVGNSGVGTAVNGLAFDNGGTLWMVNVGGALYTVNPATGAATFTGSLRTTAHHGDFNPDSDLYYGISERGVVTASPSLIIADLAAGTVVDTLPTVSDLHTLAFVPAAVPEPASLALCAAGLAAGVRRYRQRKHRA